MKKKQKRPQPKSTKLKAGSNRRTISQTHQEKKGRRIKSTKLEMKWKNGKIRDYYQQLCANKMDNL